MTKRQKKTGSEKREPLTREELSAGRGAHEEECRCKEVSQKTPLEMLRLMASDFALWKKRKSRK